MITWDEKTEKLYLDDPEGLFAIDYHEGYASPVLWEQIDKLQKQDEVDHGEWQHAPDGHNAGRGEWSEQETQERKEVFDG